LCPITLEVEDPGVHRTEARSTALDRPLRKEPTSLPERKVQRLVEAVAGLAFVRENAFRHMGGEEPPDVAREGRQIRVEFD
jgi:hypothetical protein